MSAGFEPEKGSDEQLAEDDYDDASADDGEAAGEHD